MAHSPSQKANCYRPNWPAPIPRVMGVWPRIMPTGLAGRSSVCTPRIATREGLSVLGLHT